MAPKTIRKAIADALEDLSDVDFAKFCSQLLDRRGSPRVKRRQLESKSFLEVTDVLVKTFTETDALKMALELLREIGCNEDADRLDSVIRSLQKDLSKEVLDKGDPKGDPKADPKVDPKGDPKGDPKVDPKGDPKVDPKGDPKVDPKGDPKVDHKGDPIFRRTSTGELETQPSEDAQSHADCQQVFGAAKGDVKKPEEVEAEAKACVLSEGGDPSNARIVLSRFRIQFSKYKGKTFKWLLENDVGFIVYLVSSHLNERNHSNQQNPQMANKDSLAQYVSAYPEVMKKVLFEVKVDGEALVGFGKYETLKLRSLYESKDPKKISYVDYLRKQTPPCQKPKVEAAIRYILQRDQAKRAPPTRPIKRKQFQSASGSKQKK